MGAPYDRSTAEKSRQPYGERKRIKCLAKPGQKELGLLLTPASKQLPSMEKSTGPQPINNVQFVYRTPSRPPSTPSPNDTSSSEALYAASPLASPFVPYQSASLGYGPVISDEDRAQAAHWPGETITVFIFLSLYPDSV